MPLGGVCSPPTHGDAAAWEGNEQDDDGMALQPIRDGDKVVDLTQAAAGDATISHKVEGKATQ